jgi:putative tryptophan/tyrosine transport system substrate-binding protein
MKRREFIAGLLVAATLEQARAQQSAKVHRIAFVTIAVPIAEITETSSFLMVRALFRELRRFGYIEGRNLIVERYPVERPTVELARDVVRSKPDLIFAVTHPWVQLLKPLTATIPIVATMADPVGFGFVASLAHPGGNITGTSVDAGPEIVTKRLELLKEACPQASRVGVLAARGSGRSLYSEQLQEAAQRLGLLLLAHRLEGTPQETEHRRFFEVMAQEHADSLYVVGDAESWVYRRLIVELAEKNRLPAIYLFREYVEAGGLMAYSHDEVELWTRAAGCIVQILNGASPGDIPIYQATKFDLLINLKAASAIGLTIPPSLLARADEVIE